MASLTTSRHHTQENVLKWTHCALHWELTKRGDCCPVQMFNVWELHGTTIDYNDKAAVSHTMRVRCTARPVRHIMHVRSQRTRDATLIPDELSMILSWSIAFSSLVHSFPTLRYCAIHYHSDMMLVFTFCIAQTQRWKLPVSPPLWQFIYLTFSESDVVSSLRYEQFLYLILYILNRPVVVFPHKYKGRTQDGQSSRSNSVPPDIVVVVVVLPRTGGTQQQLNGRWLSQWLMDSIWSRWQTACDKLRSRTRLSPSHQQQQTPK